MITILDEPKKQFARLFRPTKQRINKRPIHSLDVETEGNDNNFVLAVMSFADGTRKTFYSSSELKEEFVKNRTLRSSYIVTTNVTFDFFACFFDDPDFRIIKGAGGRFMAAECFIWGGGIHSYQGKSKKCGSIRVIDSLSHCPMSVKQMGKIIGIEKMENPCFKDNRGFRPTTNQQWFELAEYCYNDALITRMYMNLHIKTMEELGATFEMTIAKTCMRLLTNRFLDRMYIPLVPDMMDFCRSGLKGGRTETFARGMIKSAKLLDFTSLYPAVQYDEEYPDTNYPVWVNNMSEHMED